MTGTIKENYDSTGLISKVNNKTYVQIEKFSGLVGYEYHKGEYKSFTIEEDKCYVQGEEETATFYLNDNKICKLPVKEITSDYREFTIEDTIRDINGKMYASIEAINLAFNVVVEEDENSLKIYTLDKLIEGYNINVKKWGYSDITGQDLENKKALLYGFLIVKKEKGFYKIIDSDNTREIVSDKYNSIAFNENTEEFFVTNSLGQVGIINLDGTTEIEPVYDSISVLDKKAELYLIQKDGKYGVIKSGNITIIYPEYDMIGLDTKNTQFNIESKYLILNTLIPVYKDGKWGAYDKEGNLVYKIEYEEFGCNKTSVELNEIKQPVSPVLTIERCNGVVVKKEGKYGLIDINGEELVPIQVDSIYALENEENEYEKYFMNYNDKTLNIIERLIAAGLIEEEKEEIIEETTNTIANNTITVNLNETSSN